MTVRRHLLRGAAAAALALPLGLRAQGWPTRPVRVIVPYPAGGPADAILRLLATDVAADLGQPLVIDYRAGAGGAIGVQAVLQAEPDGATFGLGALGILSVLPHVVPKAPRPHDVQYVTMLTRSPHVLVAGRGGRIAGLPEFVATARREPGRLNFAHGGTGTSSHLAAEMLAAEAGIQFTQVPYKGAGPMWNALMAHEVDIGCGELSGVLQLGTRLQPLAVLAATRSPALPQVPTSAEAGWPAVLSQSVYGIIAPRELPAAIAERMRRAFVGALQRPETIARLEAQGLQPTPSTAAEYRQLTIDEHERYGALIRRRNLRLAPV